MLECMMSVPSFRAFEHLSSSRRKKEQNQVKIVNFFTDLKFVSFAKSYTDHQMLWYLAWTLCSQSSFITKTCGIFLKKLMNLQFTWVREQKRLARFLYMKTIHSCKFGRNFVNNSCRLNQMFTANFETKRAITGLAKWYAYSYNFSVK